MIPKKRKAYFVNEAIRNEHGELVVCIAIENEPGYFRTDIYYGTDMALAEQCVDQINKKIGLTPEEAGDIVLSSMKISLATSISRHSRRAV